MYACLCVNSAVFSHTYRMKLVETIIYKKIIIIIAEKRVDTVTNQTIQISSQQALLGDKCFRSVASTVAADERRRR